MSGLDLWVTLFLVSLYVGEMLFQWRPLFLYNKPYGSRRATLFAITKYGLSALAFCIPCLNITQVAAICLVIIGSIKEVVYFIKLKEVKEEGRYKI